jgi:DNA processing protein
MNKVNTLTLKDLGYPAVLRNIPSAPKQLYYIGANPSQWLGRPRVAVVGSRKASAYGAHATKRIVSELAGSGVVIISGLAYGIDAIAHQAALDAGGLTSAVLAGGLDSIYPASNVNLANNILRTGGSIMSEYPDGMPSLKQNFVARNRIVSGLADVLLITEAAVNSGTMHTARFARDQGKTVMSVPGNITSPGSEGCNNLIKSGALPVTEAADVFFALNLSPGKAKAKAPFRGSDQEAAILNLIAGGVNAQEDLAVESGLDSSAFSSSITMLEISGHIRPAGAGLWILA